MTKFRAIIASTLLAAALASCTTVTNPDKLKQTSTDDLCEMYYFVNHPATYKTGEQWPGKKAAIQTELNRRAAIPADQWPLVDGGKAQPGMNECALKASWGNPLQIYHKVTVDGEEYRYIYPPNRVVNLVNNQVASVQY